MEKIPKALELFQTGEFTKIQDAMIQFAKLHVEAALKDASEKIKLHYESKNVTGIYKVPSGNKLKLSFL